MKVTPHLVNFEHQGAWYEFDDGQGMYLAHRWMSQVDKKHHAWFIERIALETTLEKGFTAVGVAAKKGKQKLLFLARVEDFFGENSFTNSKHILQRGLPLNRFRMTPSSFTENVEKSMRIR